MRPLRAFSLTRAAIQALPGMADIFLSYSREDQITARRFAEGLEQAGFSVWWDQTLRSGEAYDEVTERALKSAKAVVVLWSKTSVASRWVRAEATMADRAGTLVPAMIEACDRPMMFELRQTADLSEWNGDPEERAGPHSSAICALRQELAVANLWAAPTPAANQAWSVWKLAAACCDCYCRCQRMDAGQKFHGRNRRPALPLHSVLQGPDARRTAIRQSFRSKTGILRRWVDRRAAEFAGWRNGLRVTGRTSAFYFKGKNEDMKSIGEKLGVENLLEGSVRKRATSCASPRSSSRRRTDSISGRRPTTVQLNDVFKVQEEIARSVANTLQISLGVGEIGRMPGMTRDVEAWQAYAEARALVGRRRKSESANRAAAVCRGSRSGIHVGVARAVRQLSRAVQFRRCQLRSGKGI